MTNYYVYYRVDAARLDLLRPYIQKLLKVIENEAGIRGKWMRRRDEPSTYMEVYEGVKDDQSFEALLDREYERFDLPRRREVFIAV